MWSCGTVFAGTPIAETPIASTWFNLAFFNRLRLILCVAIRVINYLIAMFAPHISMSLTNATRLCALDYDKQYVNIYQLLMSQLSYTAFHCSTCHWGHSSIWQVLAISGGVTLVQSSSDISVPSLSTHLALRVCIPWPHDTEHYCEKVLNAKQ